MKKLFSIIFSIIFAVMMLFNTAHAAVNTVSPKVESHSKTEPQTVFRAVGDAMEKIRIMSSDVGSLLSDIEYERKKTNDTYNEYDVAKLRAFLEIEDENGVKNGEKVNRFSDVAYDPDDPSTWENLSWTSEGFLYAITYGSFNFTEYDENMENPLTTDDLLVGLLDVSGMQELIDVSVTYNLIDGLVADDCPNLEMLNCGQGTSEQPTYGSRVTTVSANSCPNLSYIGADYCLMDSISIEGDVSLSVMYLVNTPNLVTIDMTSCQHSLEELGAMNSGIRYIDLSGMDNLALAYFDYCPLESINLSNNNSYFELSVAYTDVSEINLSDTVNLTGLYIEGSQISDLDLSSCSNLEVFSCADTPLRGILDISSAESLYYLNCLIMPNVTPPVLLPVFDKVILSPYGSTLSVEAINGTVGVAMGIINFQPKEILEVYAEPMDSMYNFDGWFDKDTGELLCDREDFFFSQDLLDRLKNEDISVVARFTDGNLPSLTGDIDGDGEVTVADAIMALRCTMGILELTPEQIEAGDMNESGAIEVSDAIIILRTAMGLLG